MSSRVLRKLGLQGDKDLTCLADDGSDDTEADFSSSGGAKKKQLNVNRYDLLNQQSHSESEVKEDDDHETASSLNAQEGAIEVKEATRRKKKKRKKKTGKFPVNARSSEDNFEDEVERSVREVNALLGEVGTDPATIQPAAGGGGTTGVEEGGASAVAAGANRRPVLFVEHRALNPNHELRRIFGSKIVHGDQVKKRGRNRGHMKSTWLVSPKDHWPQVGKPGLSMKLNKCMRNGLNYFCYEHSVSYQQIQMRFLDAVESMNPENIVAIINTHPYHVDGLLQLSELCRLSEDLSMAAELVERALYCLECATHPAFSLTAGNCRLDYKWQENRALYVAMFKHMMYVGARACYRTSLEFCKLLLSLDPEGDPLAVILAVDFYALRSQQYEWLLRLAAEWEPTKNLSQLPNFAYSTAVAHFQLGEVEKANECLQKALMMFPGVLIPLLDKCSVQPDSRLASSSYFNTEQATQSKALGQLEGLYVERSYHIWKESELLPWLERNTQVALDRIDEEKELVKEYEAARKRRYPVTPVNVQRHLFLSEIPKLLQPQDVQMPVFSFDPLPPADSVNVYSRPLRPRVYDNDSTLSIFFRSLMPTFSHTQVVDDGGDDSGGGGGGADLRRSVASLLDAMRDLLSNIHMPDGPGDGDIDDDSDDNGP